jgi:integrase
VRAVRDWLDFSLLAAGPLFRPINRFGKILPSRLTAQSVALIVKRWALEAGFDPMLFAGHSLRSGLATAAAKAGKSERSIMKQTGHRSASVVLATFVTPSCSRTTPPRALACERRAVGKNSTPLEHAALRMLAQTLNRF